MDERGRPTSSSSGGPPSPASFFSGATADDMVLEFLTTEVPEQWLLDDNDQQNQIEECAAAWGEGGSGPSRNPPPEAAPTRRRGRRPLPRSDGPVIISHVEAERQRRDKLHRRFCDLRAAVPTVSRMDKASLLADATAYITELRARVEQLEIEVTQQQQQAAEAASDDCYSFHGLEEKLEVRKVGSSSDAASLRLTTAARHAPARLMAALRSLDLTVQHASVCRLNGGVTVQDAVVDVPAALRDEGSLRANLLRRLQES